MCLSADVDGVEFPALYAFAKAQGHPSWLIAKVFDSRRLAYQLSQSTSPPLA
jgi:hypothetical protein